MTDKIENMDCDGGNSEPELESEVEENSDSSSSDDQDDAERLEKIRALQQQVSDWPQYYDGHVALIKMLRESGELLEARQAREAMNKHYPLSPELWLEWVRDEQSVSSSAEERASVSALLERAVKDYASVEVWTEHLLWCVGGGDITAAREVAERALAAVGTHVRDGDLVWQAVMMVETQVYATLPSAEDGTKTPEQLEQAKRIQGLIKRRFRVPLLNMDETALMEEAELWFDGQLENYMKVDLKKTLAKLKEKEPLEERLLQTEEDLVANVVAYEAYLEHTQNKDGPSELQNLYERAVLRHPLNAGLWLQYGQWCVEMFGRHADLVVPVTGRAIRNCPWSGPLCALHVEALQRCSAQDAPLRALHKTIIDVVERCLKALAGVEEGSLVDNASQIWLCYVVYLVRCICGDESSRRDDGAANDPEEKDTDRSTSPSKNTLSSSNSKTDCSPSPTKDTKSSTAESSPGFGTSAAASDVKVDGWSREDQLRRLKEACKRGVEMIREACSGPAVPGDADVSLCRLWAAVEAKVGQLEAARAVWSDVLAQKAYTGRHDLWLEFIELERRVGTVKHTRKLFRRALERVWELPEAVATAFERFEQVEGDLDTMDDFKRRYTQRMVIVNKRREESKAKEEQQKTHLAANKKGKNKGKQLNQTSRQDTRPSNQKDHTSPVKPPKAKSAPFVPQQQATAAVEANTELPPPGYPGPRIPKRPLDDGLHPAPKRVKGSDEPMRPPAPIAPQVPEGPSSRKVALGQESRTAFVSNLNYATTIEAVIAVFSDCGAIKEARLVKDFKGRSKGFGFVVFETNESLHKAIKKDRTPIGNRPMFVSEYEPDKQGHSFRYSTGKEKDKLFVRGLPYSMSEKEVKEAFEAHAPVSEIRLVTHRNGYSKGTCFVQFANPETAERVRAAMDQTELRGFTITVLISDPSAPKRQPQSPNASGRPTDSKEDVDNRHGRNEDPTGSAEVGARKPKLAFVPRILAKPAVGAPKNPPPEREEGVNGGSAPQPKSNDDFRKMLMK